MKLKLLKYWKPGETFEFECVAEDFFPHAELSVPSAFNKVIDFPTIEDFYKKKGVRIVHEDFPLLRWREHMMAFKDVEQSVLADKKSLCVAQTDSVTLSALQQGMVSHPDYFVIGTNCVLQTLEGWLLMGRRGKVIDADTVTVLPSGGIDWVYDDNFIGTRIIKNHVKAMIRKEGREEVALRDEDFDSLDMIGVYRLQKSGDPWFSCTYFGKLKIPTEEIRRRFTKSQSIYRSEGGTSNDKSKVYHAKQTLIERARTDPDIAVDVWENDELITEIDFNPKDPEPLLSSITGFCLRPDMKFRKSQHAVLSLLCLHHYGRDVCDELQKVKLYDGSVFGDGVEVVW